jgi:hypothetical protein
VRKLILLLIAFIAIATFIRAYEKADAAPFGNAGTLTPQDPGVEAGLNK